MKTDFKNPRPVIGSLLSQLQAAGYSLDSFHDGNDWHPIPGNTDREQRQALKRIVVEHKHGLIRVLEDNQDSISHLVNVTINRLPEQLASYSGADDGVKELVKEFRHRWTGKKWPTQ